MIIRLTSSEYENILYHVVFETGTRVLFPAILPLYLQSPRNFIFYVWQITPMSMTGYLWLDDLQISSLRKKNSLIFNLVSIPCSLM